MRGWAGGGEGTGGGGGRLGLLLEFGGAREQDRAQRHSQTLTV